jgi:hypothetical protein
VKRLLLLLLATVCGAAVLSPASSAHPFRGSVKWSVLLCRFSDSPAAPRTVAGYRSLFFGVGTGGAADYWRAVSYGGINFARSVVRGWYTEPMTTAQAQARSRNDKINDCIDAARNATVDRYTVPSDHRVAIVTTPGVDLFGWNGGAFLPDTVDVGAFAHEGGHGIGLDHSFSDDPNYRNAPWAQIGEYDDQWDVMSYANVLSAPTPSFGSGGPGLNAYHVDRMGWLPRSRILTFGADGARSRTVRLAALNHPEAGGYLIARVAFDPGDLFHYYTVEYRRNDGWDAGFPTSIVLIHEIKRGSGNKSYSYLIRDHTGSRAPVQTLSANGVSITVNGSAGNQATVTISSNFPDRCLQGYVWREANAADHVCVTPQTRTATAQDNAAVGSRRSPSGGAFGPDTCLQGYVWREAFPGDHVCVTPQTRLQARQDNGAASGRINPARFVYGPNTCKQGYVWREADDSDWVCVTPQVRRQTRVDNAAAASRRNPAGGAFGPDTCLQGYVWREAFPGDHVCVTPPTRAQARNDNAQAENRLMNP